MNPPSANPFDTWHFGALDASDATAVRLYEEHLFTAFAPILELNPLIRNLWDWDDPHRRLRTYVPYADQFVALMRHAATGEIAFSIGVNLHPDRHWQSGAYQFTRPDPSERACEFIIMAGNADHAAHGAVILRHFVVGYFYQELRRRGFHRAYGTSADHLRWLYRRVGARAVGEHWVDSLRRTLFRWDLAPRLAP